MKKYYLLLLCLSTSLLINAQKKRVFFYGKLKDKITHIPNSHIVNLKTGKATFSDDEGRFKILAREKDSLKITNIGYQTTIFVLKKAHFGIQESIIEILKNTITLDEVEVKKHNLFGFITRDMKQTPEDIAIVKSKGAFDFSMINFKEPTVKLIDDFSRKKAPDARKLTDPTTQFAGAGTSISGLDQYALKKRKQRYELSYKEHFPKALLSEFGEHFFFQELKIPKEKYHHFLTFCNDLNIEKLYKNGKVFEVIEILSIESKKYLKKHPNQ